MVNFWIVSLLHPVSEMTCPTRVMVDDVTITIMKTASSNLARTDSATSCPNIVPSAEKTVYLSR